MAKIILTAERCLMSTYHGALFLGFTACAPKSLFNPALYFRLVCPPVPTENGAAKFAPYGTRKIEAALLDYGFDRKDVLVVPPDKIEKYISSETKIIGITSNDPLGLGPASTTFSGKYGLIKEESYNAWKFRELISKLKGFDVKIVVGGAGAWQLEDADVREELGVDVVVIGEGEKVVPKLFSKILNGEDVPSIVYGEIVEPDEIPIIRGPTIGGVVEIARGCGRGCKFCLPTMRRLRSRPIDDILREVKINVENGNKLVTFHAEDVLRYGAKGIEVNRDAVLRLFGDAMKIAESVGMSHFALSSAASSPDVVAEISEIVGIPNKKHPWLAGQTGVETGSPRIVEKYMPGKSRPFKPEEWPEVVKQAFGICNDCHWVPCATLIIGFPDETEEDINMTIELVEDLKEYKSMIIPLFFVPLGTLKDKKGFSAEDMKYYHWELMMVCWEHNMRWIKVLAKEYLAKMPLVSRKFLSKFVDWITSKASSKVMEFVREKMEESKVSTIAKL